MYINDVAKLVGVIAKVSAQGRVMGSDLTMTESLGIHVVPMIAKLTNVSPMEARRNVGRGEVSDQTFIMCVNKAVQDMV